MDFSVLREQTVSLFQKLVRYARNNWKYGLFSYALGFVSCGYLVFDITARINDLTKLQLCGVILGTFGRYQKIKDLSWNNPTKWQKKQPFARTRPSTDSLTMYNSSFDIMNVTKYKDFTPRKMVEKLRSFTKMAADIFQYCPSYLPQPTFIKIPISNDFKNADLKALELSYPGSSAKNGILYFIHGGGFVDDQYTYSYKMLYMISKYCGVICIIIDYRVCPEYSIIDSLNDVKQGYQYVLDKYGNDQENIPIFVSGDSAGGTLALLLLQSIKNYKSLKQPLGAIVTSPPTDMTASNESVKGDVTFSGLKV